MSHNTEEAEKMVEAWKKAGTQFTVGYQNRFRPEVQNLHNACANGDLGDIYYGKAHAVRRRGVPTWGVFMGATGYVANAQQSASALNGINITTNLIFGILFLCCLIPLSLYPLNEKKNDEIIESLEKKRGSAAK